VQIPSGTATGTYFVLAVADANGQVPESLETNNSRPGVVYVGPDLTASNVKITGRTSPGATIAVTDRASNLGGGAAPASTTSYYLSSNVALDAGDVFLGGRAVPVLAPGGAHTGSADVTLPAGLAPGTYYLFAVADGPNAVPETKEYNNNGVRSMSVK
jgi:subtilase family serine protease